MLTDSSASRTWSSSRSCTNRPSDFSFPSRIEVTIKRACSNCHQDYHIVAQIGKGAFGTVFEAQVRGRRIAIKALSKSTIKRHNLAQRVRNEVSIHYQLQHPNVLELLHFFEDSEHVFLVMELAAGELYQRVTRQRLSEAEIRRVFAALVEGLSYLHSHGIIHRDLKLSNILLSDDMTPKIADFGLAVKVDENHECEQQTLCGTPNYLAPEVILKNPYGKAADLWSLGCLLFTLVVGRPPFESTDIRDTFSRVSRGDFRIPEDVSPPAKDLINRLIVLDPSQRLSLEQIKRHPYLRPPSVPLFTKSPLATLRLKPIKQVTRQGTVQILDDSRLVIDFSHDAEVVVISPDGKVVQCFSKPWGAFAKPSAEHHFPSFPPEIASRYEYGRRFVNLLRSKTPQIVLLTDSFKAYLMDNATKPFDFQMRYSSGARVEYLPGAFLVRVRHASGVEEILNTQKSAPSLYQGLSPVAREMVSECFARHEQCCEVASRIAAQRHTLPFPHVIRESSERIAIGEITAPQISTLISTSMSCIPPHLPDAEKSFEYAYKTYLPGVGWCLASPTEQFLLLFTDGQTVLIDGKKNRVAFHDKTLGSKSLWLSIDQRLPPSLKEKLSYFPRFVGLLKGGLGHSFVT